jgi:hypothetical protein
VAISSASRGSDRPPTMRRGKQYAAAPRTRSGLRAQGRRCDDVGPPIRALQGTPAQPGPVRTRCRCSGRRPIRLAAFSGLRRPYWRTPVPWFVAGGTFAGAVRSSDGREVPSPAGTPPRSCPTGLRPRPPAALVSDGFVMTGSGVSGVLGRENPVPCRISRTARTRTRAGRVSAGGGSPLAIRLPPGYVNRVAADHQDGNRVYAAGANRPVPRRWGGVSCRAHDDTNSRTILSPFAGITVPPLRR